MTAFDKYINRVLSHEGGFTTDPDDRGNWTSGRRGVGQLNGTKFGISCMSFPDLDIENLTREEAKDIYRRLYWDTVTQVSDAVRFQMLDAGINHGTHRAIMLLQKSVGSRADGKWGPLSELSASLTDNNDILLRFLAHRLRFMTDCKTWKQHGKGWARRISINLQHAAEDN